MFLPSSISYIDILVIAIALLTGIVTVLLIYILVSLILKNQRDSVEKKWCKIVSLLIQTCLFTEDEDLLSSLPSGLQKLLKKRAFKVVLIRELVLARKSFSGEAGVNLLALYKQLNLKKISLEKLQSRLWYIKAQGIQELAYMDQKEELEQIYKLANDQNEMVRMEAQLAVVQLSGFQGLKFLDHLSYHLSDWQQVKLLAELRGAHQSSLLSVDTWLNSNFGSVVLFALKLIAVYQHFELYSSVTRCLTHSEAKVRLQAILTLKEIYTEETASDLIGIFPAEDLGNQLKIINALGEIGTKEILPFLFKEMGNNNNRVKLEVARAISAIGSYESLQFLPEAKTYPWNQIILQVEQELAA